MTDVKLSGYKAEAQTALDTDLNSLADDGWSVLSAAIDNSTTGYMFADLELFLNSQNGNGADCAVEFYLVPSVDGTNYPDYTTAAGDNQENNQYFVGSITVESSANGAFRATLRGVELPPGKFKLGVRNRANDAFDATGNVLKWRPWQYSSA